MKKLSNLCKASVGKRLNRGDGGPEEDNWLVGGRYEVLQQTWVHARPDLGSEKLGQIRAKESVLLLALQSVQEQPGRQEVLLAYVANTKKPEWVSGWAQIEGNASSSAGVLRRRRLPGSWEVGGRYIVNGNPFLRARIELESEAVCEVLLNEEVLVLDLGLVIRSGEPRMRARVRTDGGEIGWLTIELPGGCALLEPLNLFSAEALRRKSAFFGEKHLRGGNCKRVSLNGLSESSKQAWEVSGKYRLVESALVQEDADLKSRVIGELSKGSLVYVRALNHVSGQDESQSTQSTANQQPILRLEISNEHTDAIGWISPLDSNNEKILDSRDHLEFEKLMRWEHAQQQAREEAEEQEKALEEEEVVFEKDATPRELVQEDPNPESSLAEPLPPQADAGSANEQVHSRTPDEEMQEGPDDILKQLVIGTSPLLSSAEASRSELDKHGLPPESFYSSIPEVRMDFISAHAKSDEADAFPHDRQEQVFRLGGITRGLEPNSGTGYRPFSDADKMEDNRPVHENIDNEVCCGILACRPTGGLFNCGASKSRQFPGTKVNAGPPATYPHHGMLGEPAPEPRPMRQLPSPAAFHATSFPADMPN